MGRILKEKGVIRMTENKRYCRLDDFEHWNVVKDNVTNEILLFLFLIIAIIYQGRIF